MGSRGMESYGRGASNNSPIPLDPIYEPPMLALQYWPALGCLACPPRGRSRRDVRDVASTCDVMMSVRKRKMRSEAD
eukprot:9450368-Pyramimonas_sp.AAC.1